MTSDIYQFVLGTHNAKKRAELDALLRPHGFSVRNLDDFSNDIDVVEDGESFAENAAKKATEQAVHLGEWVLGEDSGIVVHALQGRPGIYSARYAGENATDEDNNQKLLEELADLPPEKRGAHYVCHMAFSDPAGEVRISCEARCYGRILTQPRGSGGFGYDPLFMLREYHRTFGEMGNSIKAVLSHRARASRLFLPQLVTLAANVG